MRLLLLSIVLLPGPALATVLQNPVPQNVIDQQIQKYALRMHDKQEDAILASYTHDAVFIDPSGNRTATPAALRKLYDQVFATYDSDLHMSSPIAHQHGSVIYASGTWAETLRNRKTGISQTMHGGYRFTLRSNGRGWSFSRMQWTLSH